MSNKNYSPYFALDIATCNNLIVEDWQKRVCEILDEKGLTQLQLAEKIGVSQGSISHWLSGVRETKVSVIKRIAEALGVPIGDLFGARLKPDERALLDNYRAADQRSRTLLSRIAEPQPANEISRNPPTAKTK